MRNTKLIMIIKSSIIQKVLLLKNIIILIILFTIYSILLDELIMGCSQRRIGPFNLGYYGFVGSLINGSNLIISQYLLPKLHFHFGFQFFPLLFMLLSLFIFYFIFPFFLVDLLINLIVVTIFLSISILFIIISAFTGCSKYSMLGCIRLISQLISFELISTSIVIIFVISFNDLSISN